MPPTLYNNANLSGLKQERFISCSFQNWAAHVYILSYPLESPSHPLGDHRALSWPPRAILQAPTSSLPGGAKGKEHACQCRRHKRCRFDPWKDPWRRKYSKYSLPSSILAQRIPWTEEPGRLQSIVLQRVGHNSSNLAHTLWSVEPESVLCYLGLRLVVARSSV